MSELCFCGCQRRVRFSRRSANTLGQKMTQALEELERLGVDPANEAFAALVRDGQQLHKGLVAAAHGEASLRRADDEEILRWLRFVWAIAADREPVAVAPGREPAAVTAGHAASPQAETPEPPKPGPEPGPPPAPQPDPAPPVPTPEPGPPGPPGPGPSLREITS
jgi:hypothetical protein